MEKFIIQSGNISSYHTAYSEDSVHDNKAYSAEAVNSPIHTIQLDSTENSIVLEKVANGKYRLVSFSRETAAHLSIIRKGLNSDDKLTALLDSCVESCSPLNFFVKEKNSDKAYRVSIVPIVHTRCTKVLLTAESVTCKNNAVHNDDTPKSYSCFVSEDGECRTVRGGSYGFSDFLSSHLLCCDDICSLRPVSDSLKRGLPSSAPLILNSADGHTEFFTVFTLPISCEYTSRVIALSIIPVKLYIQPDEDGRKKNITKREKEIVNLVSSGYTNKYIAHKLTISEGTVKKTLHNAYKKLGVSSRTELVNMFHSML